MKTIKITKTLTSKELREEAQHIFNVQKRGYSKLMNKSDSVNTIYEYLKSHMPKKGTKVIMENAQHHYITLPYFCKWVSLNYGESFCIDVKNGCVRIGRVQNIGHR
jgi:CRISPR/Cas system-associated protein endoribonuclease Cas2